METLYASFADVALAQKAAGALLDHGVEKDHMSLVSHMGGESLEDDDDHDVVETAKSGISTTTAGDAASGAMKGAGVGLGIGALAALASLFIPGFGLVTGGGALAMALGAAAGTTAAGAVAGGVAGYLVDQGVPEAAAVDYEKALEHGGAIIAISLPSNDVSRTDAEQILNKYQATNLSSYPASVTGGARKIY